MGQYKHFLISTSVFTLALPLSVHQEGPKHSFKVSIRSCDFLLKTLQGLPMIFEFQSLLGILPYLAPTYRLVPFSSSFICPQQSFYSSKGAVHVPSSFFHAFALALCTVCSFPLLTYLFKSLLLREAYPEHPNLNSTLSDSITSCLFYFIFYNTST